MAKQAGETIITGADGQLVFYKMDGKGYVRRKSSLTGKQFKKQKCFAGSRASAARFGKGNSIASEVFTTIDSSYRHPSLFKQLRTAAIGLLKAGKAEEEVKKLILHSIHVRESRS